MVFREFGNFVVKLPFVHLQVFENWQTTGIVLEQLGQLLLDHPPRIEVHIVEHGIQIDVVSLDGAPFGCGIRSDSDDYLGIFGQR